MTETKKRKKRVPLAERDVVERLSKLRGCDSECWGRCEDCPDKVRDAAIAEIERLRRESSHV